MRNEGYASGKERLGPRCSVQLGRHVTQRSTGLHRGARAVEKMRASEQNLFEAELYEVLACDPWLVTGSPNLGLFIY